MGVETPADAPLQRRVVREFPLPPPGAGRGGRVPQRGTPAPLCGGGAWMARVLWWAWWEGAGRLVSVSTSARDGPGGLRLGPRAAS